MATVAGAEAMSLRERRNLMRRVHELGGTEHAEIYRILREAGAEHMQNNNGVFVNLSCVPDDVLRRVREFVDYCFTNKQDLDEYDNRLNECKASQNYLRVMAAPQAPGPASGMPPAPPAGATVQSTPHPSPPPPSTLVVPQQQCRFTAAKKKYAKRLAAAHVPGAHAPDGSHWGCELQPDH